MQTIRSFLSFLANRPLAGVLALAVALVVVACNPGGSSGPGY